MRDSYAESWKISSNAVRRIIPFGLSCTSHTNLCVVIFLLARPLSVENFLITGAVPITLG